MVICYIGLLTDKLCHLKLQICIHLHVETPFKKQNLFFKWQNLFFSLTPTSFYLTICSSSFLFQFHCFFSLCFSFATHPSLSACTLRRCQCVTDRCCITFGFPLQLYSPGNWAQLVSQGATDFHRRVEEQTPSSAIYIVTCSPIQPLSSAVFSALTAATCKTPKTQYPQAEIGFDFHPAISFLSLSFLPISCCA